MLAFLTGVAVPVLSVILMLIVGLDLRVEDFRRISAYPRTVLIATGGQVLLLPLMAVGLVHVLDASETASAGMIFLAMSPGGAISNYYTHLARRDVALSITLTAVNTLVSLISIPLWVAVFYTWLGLSAGASTAPVATVLIQLGLFVLTPICVGMWLGRKFRAELQRWKPHLVIGSLALVILLLGTVIWTVRETFVATFAETARLAVLFTLGAMLVGALLARAVSHTKRPVVVIESTVRNIPIALIIGGSLAVEPMYAGFVAAYFLVEVLIMIPYSWIVRTMTISAV